jgi:HEAT repeat protein
MYGRFSFPLSGCILLLATLTVCAGCAELNWLNPISRKQWAEDERILPSFFTHLKRIRALESQAARLDPLEQQRVAAELTRLIHEDKNITLRAAAVRSLGAFPAELSLPGIQFAAADKHPELRVAACAALGKVGDSAAVDVLAALVEHDEEIDVRLAATRELASFSDPPSIRALGIALDDPNPALQFRAMQSLKVASGRQYGDDIAMWRSWIRGEEPLEPEPSVADQVRKLWVF